MQIEATTHYPLETGGILLGWRSPSAMVVADIQGPGPTALHGRTRFIPDHQWQVAQIKHIFQDSGGDLDYLGEWHTHPDGVAELSGDDIRTLRRVARRVPRPLMLILGGRAGDAHLRCWQASRTGSVLRRATNIDVQDVKLYASPSDWPRLRRDQ